MNSNLKKALCVLIVALGTWEVYLQLVIVVVAILKFTVAIITGAGYAIITYGLCRLVINPGLVMTGIERVQKILAQIPAKIKKLFS